MAEAGRWKRYYIPGRVHNRLGPRSTVTEPDWARVYQLLDGKRGLVTAKVERDTAIDKLDRSGQSAREIATRLGVTRRTVERRRAARREAAIRAADARLTQARSDGADDSWFEPYEY